MNVLIAFFYIFFFTNKFQRSSEADLRNLESKLHEAQMEREKAEIEGEFWKGRGTNVNNSNSIHLHENGTVQLPECMYLCLIRLQLLNFHGMEG